MKIGILIFKKQKDRATRDNSFDKLQYLGFRHILSELNTNYEFTDIANIGKYDYILYSITSAYDIESLILEIRKKGMGAKGGKLIVGGAGCINITPIYDYIDIACFGRCEGQINGIIAGEEYDNVWRKENDRNLTGQYNIRQAEKLLPGEKNIGCKNKCRFCQYSWTRKHLGDFNYNANWKLEEDDLRSTKIATSGRYITAIDGFSESTRRKVNKNITDENIINFCSQIYDADLSAPANVKVYSICGFPWETPESIKQDIKHLGDIFAAADRKTGKKRLVIMIMVTPFSPEPMTPMERDTCNVNYHWGQIFENMGRRIYKGTDIECFVLPQINSPITLAKRVMLNRCSLETKDKIINIINARVPTDNKIFAERTKQYLGYNIYGEMSKAPVPYLKSYCAIK